MNCKASITFTLAVLLLFGSCRKEQMDDCFTSYGKIGIEKRIIPDFTRLVVGDNFHIVLTQDTTQPTFIELSGGKNMFKGVHAEVKNGFLTIKNTNRCNFVRDFKKIITITINAKHLNAINLTSATDITCADTLQLKYLNLNHAALSDVVLKVNIDEISINSINSGSTTLIGNARVLKGSIEEVSNLDALQLNCEEVLIDSHTSWDCQINASKIIYVRIYNSGNIYYPKTPSFLELNVREGTGDLIKK
jgi:hypothetical protein